MIEGLILSKLATFSSKEGAVYHCLRSSDTGYIGFGESYFSFIEYNAVKAWKLHQKMTLNLVVPVGMVRFNFIDLREQSDTYKLRLRSPYLLKIIKELLFHPRYYLGSRD